MRSTVSTSRGRHQPLCRRCVSWAASIVVSENAMSSLRRAGRPAVALLRLPLPVGGLEGQQRPGDAQIARCFRRDRGVVGANPEISRFRAPRRPGDGPRPHCLRDGQSAARRAWPECKSEPRQDEEAQANRGMAQLRPASGGIATVWRRALTPRGVASTIGGRCRAADLGRVVRCVGRPGSN